MRTNRQIRNRGKRKKLGVVDLDITSLLDILTILIVFLLRSYSSSGMTFDLSKKISLPESTSQTMPNDALLIHVSPEAIWVDNQLVLDLSQPLGRNIFDHQGRRIIPLFNELVVKKETIQQVAKSSPDAKPFSGALNLLVDKSIKYTMLKQIMYTAAEAGYQKYKFVVLGEGQ